MRRAHERTKRARVCVWFKNILKRQRYFADVTMTTTTHVAAAATSSSSFSSSNGGVVECDAALVEC